jgi:hypothetical protein
MQDWCYVDMACMAGDTAQSTIASTPDYYYSYVNCAAAVDDGTAVVDDGTAVVDDGTAVVDDGAVVEDTTMMDVPADGVTYAFDGASAMCTSETVTGGVSGGVIPAERYADCCAVYIQY